MRSGSTRPATRNTTRLIDGALRGSSLPCGMRPPLALPPHRPPVAQMQVHPCPLIALGLHPTRTRRQSGEAARTNEYNKTVRKLDALMAEEMTLRTAGSDKESGETNRRLKTKAKSHPCSLRSPSNPPWRLRSTSPKHPPPPATIPIKAKRQQRERSDTRRRQSSSSNAGSDADSSLDGQRETRPDRQEEERADHKNSVQRSGRKHKDERVAQ